MATIYGNGLESVECSIPGEHEIGSWVQLEVEFRIRGTRKTRTLLVDAEILSVSKSAHGSHSWARFQMSIRPKVRT